MASPARASERPAMTFGPRVWAAASSFPSTVTAQGAGNLSGFTIPSVCRGANTPPFLGPKLTGQVWRCYKRSPQHSV